MTKNVGPVFSAVTEFTGGNFRNRIFVGADIPAKKLVNARSKYITRNDPIVALIDDTLFGSAKDGLAISENYIYAKDLLGDGKSVKISSIRSVSSQSNKLGSLDIYFGGNLFATLSTIDKEDHDFVIGILKAAFSASKSVVNSAPAKVKKPSKPVAAEPKPKNSISLKETVACSECSANLPASAKFCLECGTKVLPKGVCLECNAKLPEKAKFCSECGASATNAPTGIPVPKQIENDQNMNVKDVIFKALERALIEFAASPPTQAYSAGNCHFVWQISIKDNDDTELTNATGDDFAVHCDVGILEDVIMNETENMSAVLDNVREGFEQLLSSTNETIILKSADSISCKNSSFFVYVCEVVEDGADVWRYYGEDFNFDNLLSGTGNGGTSLAYPTDFEIGEDATSNDEKNERSSRSIRVRNVTVGKLTGEGSFNGYVGFDDIDEMSSLMIFLDDDETPLGYSIKTHDKSLAVNNCDGGNVDDFFLRDQLPEALKDKWNLVLLASIDIDEAEDEGVEHYVYFPDEEAESSSPFNIESDFSNFSQVGRFLAVHQVMGWFEWNSDVELQLPLDKFLRGEIADGLLLSIDNIGFISDYETESEQLCLIHY